jgi:hypothetical protein
MHPKHHGLAIMIADKMPPPHKMKGGDGYEGEDDGEEHDGEEGDDEGTEESTVKDFWSACKLGDYKEAVDHLRDLIHMLSEPGEDEE